MIPNSAIAGLALSALLAIGAPFAVYLALRRRMVLSWRNIGIGALTFFVAALVLEQTVHYFVLKRDPALGAYIMATKPLFVLYGVLAAGIFEETGRYVAMRLWVRPTGDPGTAVAYGLGHGGLESVLIAGLPLLSIFVVSLLLNAGLLQGLVAGPKAVPMLVKIHQQLAHAGFFVTVLGGVERLIAIALQIALSMMVWRAVEMKRIGFYLLAIACHALADTGAAMAQAHILPNPLLAEVWAIGMLIVIVGLLRVLPKPAPV